MIKFNPIGIIHTPWKNKKEAPIQPGRSGGAEGYIEINPELTEGLSDLDGFSHIYAIFYFDRSEGFDLMVKPFLDTVKRGVFACRAPRRPNQIGLSVLRLQKIEGNRVYVADVDMLDGTPLLDIKPYVDQFDDRENIRTGWFENVSGELQE